MELEDQVCSLVLAKKLEGLGVNYQSFFHWCVSQKSGYSFIPESKEVNYTVDSADNYDVYSAFTVAELGELLPKSLNFQIEFDDHGKWMIHYWVGEEDHAAIVLDQNLANAMAQMLIYLIENGLVNG